jgi:DNA-binding CsgD family transcriptional regulator
MRGRGRPKTPGVLTPRESEVLDLLRRGLTNRDIADELQISLSGAKYHVSEIISKLGVATREEAAAWRPEYRSLPGWIAMPLVAFRRLTIVAAALGVTAVFVLAVVLAAARTPGSASNGSDQTASLAATTVTQESEPLLQPPWEFQGPTTALPALDGYVTPDGVVTSIDGEVLTLDFTSSPVYEVKLRPDTEVFGTVGHTIVIDTDHSRLHVGDGVLIRYDSPQPNDPSTWRVLQVVLNYFKYKAGTVVAVGTNYLDVRNLTPPQPQPDAPDVVTRVYVDPNARMETANIGGASFPPEPLDVVDAQPGMQASFEGINADDGALVAIWVKLN